MNTEPSTPFRPSAPMLFTDVDAQTLEQDETVCRPGLALLMPQGAWQDYLARMLPPVVEEEPWN